MILLAVRHTLIGMRQPRLHEALPVSDLGLALAIPYTQSNNLLAK